ncbi:MAG: hypothetical protein VX874_06305 [Pseudomonadota bacterium]|nr:hypothetical protein [Pseudomonadota bacterium]
MHRFSLAAAVALISAAPALAQSNGQSVDGQNGPAPTMPSAPAPAQVSTFSEEVLAPSSSIAPRFRPWVFYAPAAPNVATASNDEPAATVRVAPAQNRVTRYQSTFNQPLIGVYR